jgi:hypothetical protein
MSELKHPRPDVLRSRLPAIILAMMGLTPVTGLADSDELCRLFNICEGGTVIDGVSLMQEAECRTTYEAEPFQSSPFLQNVCGRYFVVKQKTSVHDRSFFVSKNSLLVKRDGQSVADLRFGDKPSLLFYVDYGNVDSIEVAELARIHAESKASVPEPYSGIPLDVQSIEMLANFEVIAGDPRHRTIVFDDASGTNLFSQATLRPFPAQNLALIQVGLTNLGASIFRQAFEQNLPLWGMLAWRIQHRFGPLTVSSDGDVGCVQTVKQGDQFKIKSCSF